MNQIATSGQDSFLDIVANLVGIMIILLVLVGARAGVAQPEADSGSDETAEPSSDQVALERELAITQLSVEKLRRDNADQHQQIQEENRLAASMTARRHQMLVELELLKQARQEKESLLQARFASWEEQDRQQQIQRIQYEQEKQKLTRQLSEARNELSAVAANAVADQPETIEHYPNPIARTVFTKEVHFRLADGQLSYVPLDELLAEMKAEWKLKAEKLGTANQAIENVGPLDGYRLQYELGLETIVEPSQLGPIQRDVIQFQRFVVLPVAGLNQETVDQALLEGSAFRARLKSFVPAETTVSIWVYPDGFADHQKLKSWLHQAGFQMASWPLMPGRPISGSPKGLKTSAQ